jgi:hypothetical protein
LAIVTGPIRRPHLIGGCTEEKARPAAESDSPNVSRAKDSTCIRCPCHAKV